MRIIECDRCHKRIKGTDKTGYINLDYRNIHTGELEGNQEFEDWDLCDDCMKLINDFVRIKVPKDTPKATIKRLPPAEGKAITKADWIRRLAGEGKTVKEICDITKASEATVRKYKAEVDKGKDEGEPNEGDL